MLSESSSSAITRASSNARATPPRLSRQVFTTSRLLEFCSQKELVLQTGYPVEQWPLVVLKELIDNAIDACEEADIAPVIEVNAKVAFDVPEEQRHRGYGGAQIESDQQHGRDRPSGMAQHGRHRPPMGSAAVFRTAMPRSGLIGKDVHARLNWPQTLIAQSKFSNGTYAPRAGSGPSPEMIAPHTLRLSD